MKKLAQLLVFFFLPFLPSCVAVVAGAAAGGAVVNDARSINQMEKDTRISHELGVLLTRRSELKTSHIVVSVFDNMVFIGGEVPDEKLRRLAEELVISHPGVKRVYNEIQVGPNNTFQDQALDAWLTTKVKTKMLARGGLRSGSIKVITEKSQVYLMGTVTHHQANLAVDVARRIEGVERVIKLFKYTD